MPSSSATCFLFLWRSKACSIRLLLVECDPELILGVGIPFGGNHLGHIVAVIIVPGLEGHRVFVGGVEFLIGRAVAGVIVVYDGAGTALP